MSERKKKALQRQQPTRSPSIGETGDTTPSSAHNRAANEGSCERERRGARESSVGERESHERGGHGCRRGGGVWGEGEPRVPRGVGAGQDEGRVMRFDPNNLNRWMRVSERKESLG